MVTPLLGKLKHIRRNFFISEAHALIGFIPVDGFHLDKVDDTFELFFCTNVELDRNRVRTKTMFNLAYYA
ncbi:Uncharacterised protein [Vibrio cholerae]|nr:Uncharacterised protein [Vibrio cholerae]CSI52566.1 Uncharacterised protein [Vibrio cholerae]